MTDLPDWTTQQQAGGIRYIGSVSVTIGGSGTGSGSLDVPLLPLDRSIIVVCPGRAGLTTTTVSVLTNDPAVSPALFSTSAEVSADPQPVNAYVSPAITSLWQAAVDMTGPPAGPYVFYVFVDSSVTHVAVDPGAASIPVGITSPAFGQGTMLQSLPVVIASDQVVPVSVSPGSQGRAQFAITDGTTDWLVGWAFVRAGAPGQAITLTFDPGIVPAVLNAGVSWFMKMTLSDIVGVNHYDSNVLVDYLAGAATAVSQQASGQTNQPAGTQTLGSAIAGGSKIVRVRADVTMRG